MRELAKQFQAEWAIRSKDNNPFRFIDKAGRAWENARYIQMLTRTTAQRVETAAFCDSMLADGFPLARISNDSGNDCDVCGAWEGRLIDLTPGHQLGSGTYTLREAREAGLFHPNCTHRLEYVSVAEIPENIFAKIKDKIGIPGAFGDNKTATKPDLPTNAQRKEHIKQVEEAAEEKAKEEVQTKIRASLEKKGVILDKSLEDIDTRLLLENTRQLNDLLSRYTIVQELVRSHGLHLSAVNFANIDTLADTKRPKTDEAVVMRLSRKHFEDYSWMIKSTKQMVRLGFAMPCSAEKYSVYAITHEFGHVLQFALERKYAEILSKNTNLFDKDAVNTENIKQLKQTWYEEFNKSIYSRIFKIANKIKNGLTYNDFYENMSIRAASSHAEFFAEAVSNAECGKPNLIGFSVQTLLREEV